jgi:hypothetical protein
MNYFL